MAPMPNIEAEARAAVEAAGHELGSLFRQHHRAAQPSAAGSSATMAVATAAPQGGHSMSLLDTIKSDIAKVESTLGSVDEAALTKLNAIMANPEAAEVLNDLAGLASIVGIPSGVITGAAGALKTFLSVYAPDPAPATQAQAAQPATAPAR